jgi:hypothetical protein
MKPIFALTTLLILLSLSVKGQNRHPDIETSLARVTVKYKNKSRTARKLTVQSCIPLPADTIWELVQRPSLLQFVARGKATFQAEGAGFPEFWKKGQLVRARIRFYGLLPMPGWHSLAIDEINPDKLEISTREYDPLVKVWNHRIFLQSQNAENTTYADEIVIYAGPFTGLVACWARSFYRHRQRRWQKMADPALRQKVRNNSGLGRW